MCGLRGKQVKFMWQRAAQLTLTGYIADNMFLIRSLFFLLITPVIVKCGRALSLFFLSLPSFPSAGAANFIYLRVDTSKVRHKSTFLNGKDVRLIAEFFIIILSVVFMLRQTGVEIKTFLGARSLFIQVDLMIMIGRREKATKKIVADNWNLIWIQIAILWLLDIKKEKINEILHFT